MRNFYVINSKFSQDFVKKVLKIFVKIGFYLDSRGQWPRDSGRKLFLREIWIH